MFRHDIKVEIQLQEWAEVRGELIVSTTVSSSMISSEAESWTTQKDEKAKAVCL
jgi:hypothetical protein